MNEGDNAVGLLAASGLALLLTTRGPMALLGVPVLVVAFGLACYLDWRNDA